MHHPVNLEDVLILLGCFVCIISNAANHQMDINIHKLKKTEVVFIYFVKR